MGLLILPWESYALGCPSQNNNIFETQLSTKKNMYTDDKKIRDFMHSAVRCYFIPKLPSLFSHFSVHIRRPTKQSLTRSITQPSFPMDQAQFLLVGLPLFLFFSYIINLFTPLPTTPPPHHHHHRHHHQQPQPKPQSASLDFPTQVCSP